MLIGLFIGVLVALGFFFAWDSRRVRRESQPLSRDRMRAGFVPGAGLRWKLLSGVALMSAIMGAYQSVYPTTPPFSGKLAFLFAWAHNILGLFGPAIICFTFTVVFAGVSYAEFRKQTSVQGPSKK